MFNVRVVHIAPPQLAAQLQVFGAVHVPPLAHAGEHTAETQNQ